jgi:Zn-dependent protease with chaperone function
MLRAFVAQSILHALVAGLVVEALLYAWRVEDGRWRLRFRLVALAEPIVVLPLLFLFPWRTDPSFGTAALFASERWNLVAVGGAPLGDVILVCAAGSGAALFLRDAAPPLLDALRGATASAALPASVPPALDALVRARAAALGIAPPEVRLLRLRAPVLLCEAAARPALVISTGTLDRLDADQLDAAVAHELAHAAHRDPAWGYVLIAVRALAFFSPAAQWTARAAVEDLERRADQVARRLTGRPAALAAAIRTLTLGEAHPPSDVSERFERMFWASRVASVERRCARLHTGPPPEGLDGGPVRLALAAAGIIGLLFFVV